VLGLKGHVLGELWSTIPKVYKPIIPLTITLLTTDLSLTLTLALTLTLFFGIVGRYYPLAKYQCY